MISDKLPSVLVGKIHGDSISMERALKQIKDLLENGTFSEKDEDRINASLDDIELMLVRIVN